MNNLQYIGGIWVHDQEKVLLLKTLQDASQPNKWGPPAGHMNPGETLAEAAIRETKEESGLTVDIEGLVSSCLSIVPDGRQYIMAFYKANKDSAGKVKIDPNEVADYIWATKEEVESGKYQFRKKFLMISCLRSFDSPAPINTFSIETTE